MKVKRLHSWQVSPTQALDLQRRLATQVSGNNQGNEPHFVAGVDVSTERTQGIATAAVIVLQYPELLPVEIRVVRGKLSFPYIPGLLSFREAPLTLNACRRLTISPDLIMVDGQGIAHPRRIGLASHLGLFLDTPTIGCAKSLLCGNHGELDDKPGNYAKLIDQDEIIGVALRTKSKVKPVYISVGHKIDLQAAIKWVLRCCRGYRLPEPTRLAHLLAKGSRKGVNNVCVRVRLPK